MTALNTPVGHRQAGHDFRRGLLVGAAAAALLATSMIAAAFGAGVIGTMAPDAVAPAAPAAPAVEPYTDFGPRNPPPATIDQDNPHQNGPIQAW